MHWPIIQSVLAYVTHFHCKFNRLSMANGQRRSSYCWPRLRRQQDRSPSMSTLTPILEPPAQLFQTRLELGELPVTQPPRSKNNVCEKHGCLSTPLCLGKYVAVPGRRPAATRSITDSQSARAAGRSAALRDLAAGHLGRDDVYRGRSVCCGISAGYDVARLALRIGTGEFEQTLGLVRVLRL